MPEALRQDIRRSPRTCIQWDGSPYLRRTCGL